MNKVDTRTFLRQRRDELVAELEELNKALEALGEAPVKLGPRRRKPRSQSEHTASAAGPTRGTNAEQVELEIPATGLAAAIYRALPADGSVMTMKELKRELPPEFAAKDTASISASLSYLKTRKGVIESAGKGVYRRKLQ